MNIDEQIKEIELVLNDYCNRRESKEELLSTIRSAIEQAAQLEPVIMNEEWYFITRHITPGPLLNRITSYARAFAAEAVKKELEIRGLLTVPINKPEQPQPPVEERLTLKKFIEQFHFTDNRELAITALAKDILPRLAELEQDTKRHKAYFAQLQYFFSQHPELKGPML